jgi:hypothetical protein
MPTPIQIQVKDYVAKAELRHDSSVSGLHVDQGRRLHAVVMPHKRRRQQAVFFLVLDFANLPVETRNTVPFDDVRVRFSMAFRIFRIVYRWLRVNQGIVVHAGEESHA